MRESIIAPTFYFMSVDGRCVRMMSPHADDLFWACEPEYEHVVDHILQAFDSKEKSE